MLISITNEEVKIDGKNVGELTRDPDALLAIEELESRIKSLSTEAKNAPSRIAEVHLEDAILDLREKIELLSYDLPEQHTVEAEGYRVTIERL